MARFGSLWQGRRNFRTTAAHECRSTSNNDRYVDASGWHHSLNWIVIKGPFVCIFIYLRTKQGWQSVVGRFPHHRHNRSFSSCSRVSCSTFTTQRTVHHTVHDSLWHHPKILLKQLLECDVLKLWFWCMCTRTAVTVYSATVWRVDLIREEGMWPLTSDREPSAAAAAAALSDCSVWHGNHFQNPVRPPRQDGRRGGGGGGGVWQHGCWRVLLKSSARCIDYSWTMVVEWAAAFWNLLGICLAKSDECRLNPPGRLWASAAMKCSWSNSVALDSR